MGEIISPKNYYIILGIPANSKHEEIKAAYRRLAKEFHPDRHGQKNSPFLTIQEAYSVLGDPVQRRKYDKIIKDSRQRREKPRNVEAMAYYRPIDEMGNERMVTIALTSGQASRGGHVRLQVPVRLRCPACNGRGNIGHYECWRCSGAGLIRGECPVMVS